jgi:hypothetical protein
MKALSFFTMFGITLLTSCSTQRPLAKAEPKFHEVNTADFILRFYSENVSRVLKPLQMEGPFLTTFDRAGVLDLAKQQPGRELAVVVLVQFNSSDRVKQSWLTPLEQMGYKRVVFLRAKDGRKLDGLSILDHPSQVANTPKAPADPKDQHTTTGGG